MKTISKAIVASIIFLTVVSFSNGATNFSQQMTGRYFGYSTEPNSSNYNLLFRFYIYLDGFRYILYSPGGHGSFSVEDINSVPTANSQNISSGVLTSAEGSGHVAIHLKSFNYRFAMTTTTSPKEEYIVKASFKFNGNRINGTLTTIRDGKVFIRHVRCVKHHRAQ